jgi:hypothetical protein
MSAPPSTYGKNHKGEKILKIFSRKCPFCEKYMRYFEFQFDVDVPQVGPDCSRETANLSVLQNFERILEETKRGEKLKFFGVLIGCERCYLNRPKALHDRFEKKPYIVLDAEDVFKMSQIPISHVYLTEPII